MVNRWLSAIRDNKAGIVALLATKERPSTAWRWLIHFADRNPLEVAFSPEASHAEALEAYPDALAAEPLEGESRTLGTPS